MDSLAYLDATTDNLDHGECDRGAPGPDATRRGAGCSRERAEPSRADRPAGLEAGGASAAQRGRRARPRCARGGAASAEPRPQTARCRPRRAQDAGPAAGRRRPRVRARRAHHPADRLHLRVHAVERAASAAHASPGDHGQPGQDLRPRRGEDPHRGQSGRRARDPLAAPRPGGGGRHQRPGPAQRTRSPALDGPCLGKPATRSSWRGEPPMALPSARSAASIVGRSSRSSTATAPFTTGCRTSSTRPAAGTTSSRPPIPTGSPWRRPRRASSRGDASR